ncbi:MAG: TIGR04086 family membrane protein [Clostridium sp.]|uniref:TIGR04086 family membrane protein n=1 Tax=Clostridium sp. TaxID=1506 RepID=UPI00305BDDEF
MYKKFNYSAIGYGVFRASILTVIFVLVYSLVTAYFPASNTVTSVFLVIATLVSVVYGSIYATLKMGKKGWIVGLLVGLFYMIILYIVSLCFGKEISFGTKDIVRLILALAAGSLSGMLGVNL